MGRNCLFSKGKLLRTAVPNADPPKEGDVYIHNVDLVSPLAIRHGDARKIHPRGRSPELAMLEPLPVWPAVSP